MITMWTFLIISKQEHCYSGAIKGLNSVEIVVIETLGKVLLL